MDHVRNDNPAANFCSGDHGHYSLCRRKTESFGIAIPQEVYNKPTLVKFRKRYAHNCAILGGIVTILLIGLIPVLNEIVGRLPMSSAFSVIYRIFLYLLPFHRH